MIEFLFNFASSNSDVLYSLGCWASHDVVGYTPTGQAIMAALCIA